MKIKTILVFSLIIILTLCGCQKTPDVPVVINKGNGELENIIAGSTASSQTPISEKASEGENIEAGGVKTYPEEWKETYTVPHLTCNIDADLILPSTNEFSVYKVKQGSFDSEEVKKVVDYFTKGSTGVRETSDTKEELEEELVLAKKGQYIWDDNGGRWEPYDGQQKDIANIEEQIKNAQPEVFNPVTDDTISALMKKTYAMPNNGRIYVSTRSNIIDISSIKYGLVQPESWVVLGDAYPGEPVGTTINNIKISENEAEHMVKNLLSDLGINNLGIAKAEKARIIKDFSYRIESEGWQITLARNDGNSIPVNINSSEVSGLLQYQSEDYVNRWQPESITVYVDENGPRCFNWQNPINVVEIMSNNVPIISFDKIKETIREYIKLAFAKVMENQKMLDQQVTLNKIILTNVLAPIKDDNDHHMLIPAWVVYYQQEDRIGIHTSILAINAIDGSSIDLSLHISK